ncbi:MAG: hypothetical protein IV105_24975 [Rhizobacter sp.]|nr:hypothetical protein [Rhizobacter sp.]
MNGLNLLLGEGPMSSSPSIAARSSRHYRLSIQALDQIYSARLGKEIAPALERLPAAAKMFLLRTGPVRTRIDALFERSYDANWDAEGELLADFEDLYRYVCRAVTAASSAGNGRFFDDTVVLSGPKPFECCAWVGGAEEAEDIRLLFAEQMSKSVGIEPCVLVEMDEQKIGMARAALEILGSIDLRLLTDVVANVRHICLIDYERWVQMSPGEYRDIGQSVSSHNVPSTCFFSLESFSSIEKLTEAVYHEALHKKLSNLILSSEILKPGFDFSATPTFLSHWNRNTSWNSNVWGADRALYAYHVYVHLLVLYGAMLRGDLPSTNDLSTSWISRRFEHSAKRAADLGAWLSAHEPAWAGREGAQLMAMLSNAAAEYRQ